MFRYPSGQFQKTLPSQLTIEDVVHPTSGWTTSQWNEHGYYKAQPLKREAFTTYTTKWELEDGVYKEVILGTVVDEDAKAAAETDARKIEIENALEALDAFIPRSVEDMIEADVFTSDKLSTWNQDRLAEKQALRTELASL